MRIISVIIILLIFTRCNVYTTASVSKNLTSDSGNIIAHGKYTYTKSKTMDRYDYYQKWDNSYIEYYDNGSIKSTYSSSHKRATYGRPCKEVISHYTTFYPSGIKSYEQKDICDCSKSITITYNQDGKIVEKRIVRTRTKEVKKKK